MPNIRAVLLSAALFLVGLALGVAGTTYFTGWFMGYAQTTSALATVAMEGVALEKMAASDVAGATKVLNIHLDGELLQINAAVDEGFTLTPKAKQHIERVRKLRQAAGYVPADSQVHAGVEEIFSRATQ